MIVKALFGIVAAGLLILFVAPVVLKLKELALTIVVLIGLGMMVIDLVQSLREKDE